MEETNALAYYTVVKKVLEFRFCLNLIFGSGSRPGANVIKLFTAVSYEIS